MVLDTLLGDGSEADRVQILAWSMIVCAAATLPALVLLTRAPYGRYFQEGSAYGLLVPGRLAWIFQEAPTLVFAFGTVAYSLGRADTHSPLAAWPNRILLALFTIHYTHRTLVFPLRLEGGKPTPIGIMLMAMIFCIWNGYLQTAHLSRLAEYPADWLWDPRFIIGVAVFFTGMIINIHSDYTLIGLRKPGESGYKIPHGGLFEYVSSANYFGECLEWAGYAIAGWSLVPAAFAIFTFANTAPRGYKHHLWYQEKFEDYPKHRKAVIPYLW